MNKNIYIVLRGIILCGVTLYFHGMNCSLTLEKEFSEMRTIDVNQLSESDVENIFSQCCCTQKRPRQSDSLTLPMYKGIRLVNNHNAFPIVSSNFQQESISVGADHKRSVLRVIQSISKSSVHIKEQQKQEQLIQNVVNEGTTFLKKYFPQFSQYAPQIGGTALVLGIIAWKASNAQKGFSVSDDATLMGMVTGWLPSMLGTGGILLLGYTGFDKLQQIQLAIKSAGKSLQALTYMNAELKKMKAEILKVDEVNKHLSNQLKEAITLTASMQAQMPALEGLSQGQVTLGQCMQHLAQDARVQEAKTATAIKAILDLIRTSSMKNEDRLALIALIEKTTQKKEVEEQSQGSSLEQGNFSGNISETASREVSSDSISSSNSLQEDPLEQQKIDILMEYNTGYLSPWKTLKLIFSSHTIIDDFEQIPHKWLYKHDKELANRGLWLRPSTFKSTYF